MKKQMTILYPYHNNLYVNLTNRCPCACIFCIRNNMDSVSDKDDNSLWLEREPSLEEIKTEFNKFNMDLFEEVVFCGFGEPTERLDVLLQVASFVKEKFNKKIRVNTNGLSDLIWNKDTAPDFFGKVDTVSISLNNPSSKKYFEIVKPKFGEKSFEAMLNFAGNVKNYVKNVILSTVETVLTKDEEEECAKICKNLGVTYRIRKWNT